MLQKVPCHKSASGMRFIHASTKPGLTAIANRRFKGLNQKEAVFKDSHSTTEQEVVAEKIFKPVTERLKEGLEPPAQCRAV